MNTSMTNMNTVRKGILLGLPFLLFFIGLTLLASFMTNRLMNNSGLFLNDLTQKEPVEKPSVEENTGSAFYVPAQFPSISMGQEYAKLTVEDAQIYNEPVYFGDTYDILKKGVGQFAGSRFPGQNGNCVLVGHVTTIFRYLETLQPGARFELNTIYGEYVYEMEKSVLFHYDDDTLLLPNDGTDYLTVYTCYPYDNHGVDFRTERIAIICKKISGKNWKTGEE